MRLVEWTEPAERSADRFLAMLMDINPAAAKRAREEIQGATRRFMWMPTPGRISQRWPGCRELSLLRWNKVVVFKVMPDCLFVLAFLDARQDFDTIDLTEK